MLEFIFSISATVVYVIVLVLLVLARRWDEQRDEFRRAAGILGLMVGLVTLGTNLWLTLDEFSWDGPHVLLLVLALTPPLLVMTGAILCLLRQKRGPGLLVWSVVAWLAITLLGYVGTVTGFYS